MNWVLYRNLTCLSSALFRELKVWHSWHWAVGNELPRTYKMTYYSECKLSTSTLSYLPTPPLGQDMTQGQFLSGV